MAKRHENIEGLPGAFKGKEAKTEDEKIVELKQENEKMLRFLEGKEKIKIQNETKDKLLRLKDALESGSEMLADALKDLEESGTIEPSKLKEIQETATSVLEQIDALDDLPDIGDIVPDEFRVTRELYEQALVDESVRPEVQAKIQGALGHMAHVVGNTQGNFDLFSDAFMFLDKNLVLVQETHIDMDRGLQRAGR